MFKRITSIVILFTILLMSSCMNNNSQEKSNTNQPDIQLMSFEEKFDFYQKRYPDSNILVWVVDSNPQYELELNDYLSENDYNYAVCFKSTLDATSVGDEFIKTNLEVLSEMINNDEQIDIIDSLPLMSGIEVGSNSYYQLIDLGYFEPLDEYLKDDKYSDVINSMPKNYWDSYRYNNKIYGIDNRFSTLCADNGYAVNNEIFDKSKLKPDDFKLQINELEPILKEVVEKTNKKMYINIAFFISNFFPSYYLEEGIGIVNGKFVNMYEQEELINYYKLFNDLTEKGLATIDSIYAESSSLEFTEKSAAYGKTIKNNLWNTTNIFFKQNNYISIPYEASGIFSGSKNKEQALELLMNLKFNENFNNVITYGIEGKTYEIVDGKVEMKTNENSMDGEKNIVDTWFNNPMISLPCEESESVILPLDYYKAYENAEFLDGLGFCFDGTAVKDKYLNVVNIIQEFNISVNDFDSYMEKFNKKLYDAGLQDIIDEANRQLEEYYEKNN